MPTSADPNEKSGSSPDWMIFVSLSPATFEDAACYLSTLRLLETALRVLDSHPVTIDVSSYRSTTSDNVEVLTGAINDLKKTAGRLSETFSLNLKYRNYFRTAPMTSPFSGDR